MQVDGGRQVVGAELQQKQLVEHLQDALAVSDQQCEQLHDFMEMEGKAQKKELEEADAKQHGLNTAMAQMVHLLPHLRDCYLRGQAAG
jgi:hypothetical protein